MVVKCEPIFTKPSTNNIFKLSEHTSTSIKLDGWTQKLTSSNVSVYKFDQYTDPKE